MTGFAARDLTVEDLRIYMELRGVNARFLDLSFRLPDELRQVEPILREKLNGALRRGKVECRVSVQRSESSVSPINLNWSRIEKLMAAQALVKTRLPDAEGFSVPELLRWPDVLLEAGLRDDALHAPILQLMEGVLKDFLSSRGREGEKLSSVILEQVGNMQDIISKIAPLIPQAITDLEAKLIARLLEVMGTYDEERIRQEMVIFAQRIDVSEELNRLNVHLGEVDQILRKGGVVGKRLDFLMQELNREANTLGSKSANIEVSKASMTLKVMIEQIREQVQNLE